MNGSYEKLTHNLVKDEVSRYMRNREFTRIKQDRKPKIETPNTEALEYIVPKIFTMEEAEGINRVLNMVNNHTWIYELGFRRTKQDGTGGRLYNPDLSYTYDLFGRDQGIKILAGLIGAEIPEKETGSKLLYHIISSDFFSMIETGINYAYELEDIKEIVDIEGRGAFINYFRLGRASVAMLHVEMLRIFYGLRTIEDQSYKS